ncbi:MAG: glutamine amidotransferase [Hyphomicrobiales bacterium]|nr:glutamine amidotransferase [Hyphomicrobiales bacterium]
MARKVLIVLHQENSTSGRVGQALVGRGFSLDIRRPRFGDALPATMDDHAAAVIFGGPMSANDTDAYLRRETDWIGVALKAEKPFLGICLGAQLMVRHLGGRVCTHPQGCVEVGYYPIHPTAAGRRMMDWPSKVYQWHREGFELPRAAELLAEGVSFENQAFRYGPAAYGIQFHPELTLAMLHRWTVRGAPRMQMPGAQDRRAHFDGRALYDADIKAWLDRFLDLWIAPPRLLCEKTGALPKRSHDGSRNLQHDLQIAMRRG